MAPISIELLSMALLTIAPLTMPPLTIAPLTIALLLWEVVPWFPTATYTMTILRALTDILAYHHDIH